MGRKEAIETMRWLNKDGMLMPVVLGLSDGILTALTLSAGRLVNANESLTFILAARIAIASLASGAFVFFVSNYSRLRGELIHAETQLNLTSHGQFAASRLGRAVLREAVGTTVVSSGSSFIGALIPLVTGAWFQEFRWAAISASLLSLGILGLVLARSVHGRYWVWCIGLVCGGTLVLLIGVKLSIV
jgi:VIT1/CCC1 family predicted Fe2+/Mn2+ transporter